MNKVVKVHDQTTPGQSGAPSDSAMGALGELICSLNPYTGVTDQTTGQTTGKMQVGMLPAADDPSAPGFPVSGTIGKIAIEIERNYGAPWTFKGQTLNVKTAVRIPYRFAVMDEDGNPLYWQTEYLLIGYAGDQGGG